MSRKTIAWIIIGVLAAVVVAAVGVVSYRAGFDHGVSSGVVRRVRMPMAGMNGNGVEFGYRVVRVGAFPGLGLLVGLLAVGAIGALIAYLVSSGGRAAPVALPGRPLRPAAADQTTCSGSSSFSGSSSSSRIDRCTARRFKHPPPRTSRLASGL